MIKEHATVVRDNFLNARSRRRRFLVSVKQIMLSVVGGGLLLLRKKKMTEVFILQWQPVHFQKLISDPPYFSKESSSFCTDE